MHNSKPLEGASRQDDASACAEPAAWRSLGNRDVFHVGHRLRVSLEHVLLPDGREVEDYLQLGLPDFATIVALTVAGDVICERQYKHGPRRISLTLPAGAVEAGESLQDAARRELLEETGYVSDEWQFLGTRTIHANAGGGRTHAFMARNCRKVAEPDSGDLEAMIVELKSLDELIKAIHDNEMPLVADAAALLPALLLLRKEGIF